jgi:arabinogalactan endo-1,4-beta-galactosidase
MFRSRRRRLAVAAGLVVAGCAGPSARAPALPPGFMLGADISTLETVERAGARFSIDGRPGEALPILQAAGIGWVRLRLWHTPHEGGGDNDLALTTRLARRAKAQGLRVLLDLHYSDFWADPGRQDKPAAWATLHGEALAHAVRGYTADVLRHLRANGAAPDMVQLGNEINGGLLWPDGKTWQQTPEEQVGGEASLIALLRAAFAAVREADARDGGRLPVMLHLAGGGDNALFRHLFDLFTREGLDYDVIGLSHYTYFHGPLAGLRANLADLSARYGKPLVVVETAYGYTLDNVDSQPNVFDAERAAAGGYPATPAGQAQALREVIEAVAAAPQGAGVFYWEPAWLARPGAGWRHGEGNGWENQALFDAEGRALPALREFSLSRRPP